MFGECSQFLRDRHEAITGFCQADKLKGKKISLFTVVENFKGWNETVSLFCFCLVITSPFLHHYSITHWYEQRSSWSPYYLNPVCDKMFDHVDHMSGLPNEQYRQSEVFLSIKTLSTDKIIQTGTVQRWHSLKKQILINTYTRNVFVWLLCGTDCWLRGKQAHKSVYISFFCLHFGNFPKMSSESIGENMQSVVLIFRSVENSFTFWGTHLLAFWLQFGQEDPLVTIIGYLI